MVAQTRVEESGMDPLLARIGTMLMAQGLDLSPSNYALCHRYLTDPQPEHRAAVDDLIARHGSLTVEALDELAGRDTPPISADALQRIADDATACLHRITGIIEDNGRAAQDYSDALAGEAASLSNGGRNGDTVRELVALTRMMIDRSRDASDHLRRNSVELDSLRTKLTEVRQIADSDPLTGLPNRRALDIRMTAACDGAREAGTPLAVAICDIDHFKRVNDEHGHHIGDEVIKMIATALGTAGDAFVSRYGGEEFVVLFANATLEEAAARVDAIRQSVAERNIKIAATGRRLGRVSFSAGVATLRPRGTASAMLKRADKALYRAKNEGRDRVVVEIDQD